MIRNYTLILCSFFLSSTSSAQSWCPPGATWTYEAGMFLAGYHRMSYVGDSMIDGYSAQIIDRTSVIQYPQPPPGGWSSPQYSYTPVAVITRTEADVVYLLDQNEWDTLYYFNALPGEGWTAPHISDTTCVAFVVNDTGTVIIDGSPIRWIEITGWYRIYERIGSTWDMMMFCPNWIMDGPTGMRCYNDDQIDTTFTNYEIPNGCDWLMETEDPDPHRSIPLHPNPGTDHFTLQLSSGQHHLCIFDALGRSVIEATLNSDQAVIDTRALPSGVYHVHLTDHSGSNSRSTWTKQ